MPQRSKTQVSWLCLLVLMPTQLEIQSESQTRGVSGVSNWDTKSRGLCPVLRSMLWRAEQKGALGNKRIKAGLFQKHPWAQGGRAPTWLEMINVSRLRSPLGIYPMPATPGHLRFLGGVEGQEATCSVSSGAPLSAALGDHTGSVRARTYGTEHLKLF